MNVWLVGNKTKWLLLNGLIGIAEAAAQQVK